MSIKAIPLSSFEANPGKTLSECADTGATVVVQLPDSRLVAIHALDPTEDDDLIERLIESNPAFQALLAKANASPSKPFKPRFSASSE
jgi:hypothetical protein